MFERRQERLAPRQVFNRRLALSGAIGLGLVVVSLAAGMAGYAGLEGLSVADAFINAAMILSGMGPLFSPETTAGKLFAGFYALYSGFAVLAIPAIVFAPVVHRVMHHFHLEDQLAEEPKAPKPTPPRERSRRGGG